MVLRNLALVAAAAAASFAGGRRADPTIFVRFHVQADTSDPTFTTPVQLNNPARRINVEKIPSINERDLISFRPYRAEDGTFGAAFQLDRHGQLILQTLSMQKRQQLLVATVNGRILTPMLIDRTIRDGIIYVPYGFTLGEIHTLGEFYKLTKAEDLIKQSDNNPESNPLAPQAVPKR